MAEVRRIRRAEGAAEEYAKKVEEQKKAASKKFALDTDILIDSGCTLLNLACSDCEHGAFLPGKYVNLIGDSSSGKTLLALTMLAILAEKAEYDEYDIIYDGAEVGNQFDVGKIFGANLASRLRTDVCSRTIESFQNNIVTLLKSGKPFIDTLDSFDGLTSSAELARFYEEAAKRAAEAGDLELMKEAKGSYKTEKAKIASEILRVIAQLLEETQSFLLIISQTRDNIGFGSMFKPKTRSGGNALKFYAEHEIWLSVGKAIKGVGGKITVGHHVQAKITKNRLTGKKRTVDFKVYDGYGVDDIGSNIDYMIAEGSWTKSGQKINPRGLGDEEPRSEEKLIEYIEDNNLEEDLRMLVGETWRANENKATSKINTRKQRFA